MERGTSSGLRVLSFGGNSRIFPWEADQVKTMSVCILRQKLSTGTKKERFMLLPPIRIWITLSGAASVRPGSYTRVNKDAVPRTSVGISQEWETTSFMQFKPARSFRCRLMCSTSRLKGGINTHKHFTVASMVEWNCIFRFEQNRSKQK